MVDVNLMGPISVLECFVPPMIEAGRGGHVVNVSSAAGLFGLPWHAAYSASKFGLRGVSEVLRFDLRRHRIGVSLVCPGAVRTPLVDSVEIVGVDRSDPRIRREIARFERHAVSPERVAEQDHRRDREGPLHGLHLGRHQDRPLGPAQVRARPTRRRCGCSTTASSPSPSGAEPAPPGPSSRFGWRIELTEPALDIENLVKTYPTGVEALRSVSLQIQPGEFFGLLGPNGAGKSTLIHCTTGLAQVTSGSIRTFGHDAITDYEASRLSVGLAPQEPNIDWFLTVEETLDYHAGYFGVPKRERRERAKELLETFSLTEKRDERTRTLSGGMKRRLILARAMMHRPRLLILDEPTAGVDVELRLELWHYVQRINQEGTTILLTTHYIEEAEQLCDKIAFINHGEIVAEGTSEELASSFGVVNLEDAYLALVGRKELSRSHIEVEEVEA